MRSGSTAAFIGLAACMGLVVFVSAKRATEVSSQPSSRAPVAMARVQPSLIAIKSTEAPRSREQSADVPVEAPLRSAGESAPSEESFFQELERLQATDKARALTLARKGEAWYLPTGELAEARKAMIVTLLVDTGDMTEARQLARQFIAAFPSSDYRPLVQGVTGVHPRPSGPR
jgi:hypothetical protein